MISKEDLIAYLSWLADPDFEGNAERNHEQADELLLQYINDEEITAAFNAIYKWYA